MLRALFLAALLASLAACDAYAGVFPTAETSANGAFVASISAHGGQVLPG